MRKEIVERVTVTKRREALVSDFTGIELTSFHWSAIQRIQVLVIDGAGNKQTILSVDGFPEEIADLKTEIQEAFRRVKEKHSARVKGRS